MQDGFDRKRRTSRPPEDSPSRGRTQRGARPYSNRSARGDRDARFDDAVSYRSSYSSSSDARDQGQRPAGERGRRPAEATGERAGQRAAGNAGERAGRYPSGAAGERTGQRPRQASDAYRDRDRYRSANRGVNGSSAGVSSGRGSSTSARTSTSRTPRRGDASAQQRNRRPSQNSFVAYDGRAPQRRQLPKPLLIGIAAALVLVVGIGGFAFAQTAPITVSVNGVEHELGGDKNIEAILDEGFASPQPGDLVDVAGETLTAGEGDRLFATVNGQETRDYAARLASNDQVTIENGHDTIEPFKESTVEVDFAVREEGVGTITVQQSEGVKGVIATRVGDISGKTAEVETQVKQDQVFYKYNPKVGTDKVIALTFDDGPWGDQTQQILDILAENDAKATFFVVGERVVGDGIDLVKKAKEAGHQVATHTYSHASGSGGGVDMGKMKPEEQIAEVTKGYEAIKNATGEEPSHIFRSPGGNYSLETMKILVPYVQAEIRWNIDTEDWRKPGPEVIADHILSAKPGSIVLAHDGGGKRGETIEGLKAALPQLKEQGYRFITIDELLEYPAS